MLHQIAKDLAVAVNSVRRVVLAGCICMAMLGLSAAQAGGQPSAGDPVAPLGATCSPSLGSGGLQPGQHEITIDGNPVFLRVGAEYTPATPTMLMFYLHGDDRIHTRDFASNLVDQGGWIHVAPQAPASWLGVGVGSSPGANDLIESNAAFLERVFDEIRLQYNVCQDVMLGTSASGGSWFYDGYFLPTRGSKFPTFMNLGCGSSGLNEQWSGLPFYSDLTSLSENQAVRDRHSLHYTIGSDDFLFPAATRSIEHYASLGFTVTSEIFPDVGHCLYDLDAEISSYLLSLCQAGHLPAGESACGTTSLPSDLTCDGARVTIDLGSEPGRSGTPGDDVIMGSSGPDVINGAGGNDIICGLGGDDIISGGLGDDIIFGGEGNDRINGDAGKDRIRGQNGNDTINGGDGNDNLNGNNGNDTVNGGAGNDYVSGRDGKDTVTGGPGNDTVNGGGKQDVLRGGPGDDTINGNGYADTIWGGTGNDTINGGDGPDHLRGERGNDTLLGGRGNDTLWGGNGTDTCDGKTGYDTQINCQTIISIP